MLDMESSSRAYAASGSARDKEAFDMAAARVAVARREFDVEAHEKTVSLAYVGANTYEPTVSDVCAVDAIALEALKNAFARYGEGAVKFYVTDKHRVTGFTLRNFSGDTEVGNAAVAHAFAGFPMLTFVDVQSSSVSSIRTLPKSLDMLLANGTQIDDLPDIPDDVKSINISNTPAAGNQRLRDRIVAFKATHPDFRFSPA